MFMLLFNYFEWADLSEVSLKGILIFDKFGGGLT